MLERNSHKCPAVIRRHMKKAGYIRSETAIILKRKRMRYLQNIEGQSANSLAECFGVDAKTVTRWIHDGSLKAADRGTKRTPQQGGDMYYIKEKWIKDFIVNNIGLSKQPRPYGRGFANQAIRLVAYGRFTSPLPRLAITIAAFISALAV